MNSSIIITKHDAALVASQISKLAPQPTNEERLNQLQNALGDTAIYGDQIAEDEAEYFGEVNLSDADEFCDFKGWKFDRFIREINTNADEFYEFCVNSRKYSLEYAMVVA